MADVESFRSAFISVYQRYALSRGLYRRRAALQAYQILNDLGLGPLDRANELATHNAILINDEGFGIDVCAVQRGAGLIAVANRDHVPDFEIDQELAVVGVAYIFANR